MVMPLQVLVLNKPFTVTVCPVEIITMSLLPGTPKSQVETEVQFPDATDVIVAALELLAARRNTDASNPT